MWCSIRFFLSDHTNTVLAPCRKGNQGESGAKTVPRNHTNKNTPHKNSEFMRFWTLQNTEKT